LKSDILQLLKKINNNTSKEFTDIIEKMKQLTNKITIDNLNLDVEKAADLAKRVDDLAKRSLTYSASLIDKELYAKRYFSVICNNDTNSVSNGDTATDKIEPCVFNDDESLNIAFMYKKFVFDKNKYPQQHMYDIIDLLHKITTTTSQYTLTDEDKILIAKGGDEILTTSESKKNIEKLFTDKKFAQNLYNLLISEVKLLDVLGKEHPVTIVTENGARKAIWSPSLAPGPYTLQLLNTQGIHAVRIIVK
jgi:hypothetical protein